MPSPGAVSMPLARHLALFAAFAILGAAVASGASCASSTSGAGIGGGVDGSVLDSGEADGEASPGSPPSVDGNDGIGDAGQESFDGGAGVTACPGDSVSSPGVITLASGLSIPLGIVVDSNSVYWTDQAAGTVMSVSLDGGALTTL